MSRKEIVCHECNKIKIKENWRPTESGLDFCSNDCFCNWYQSCSKQSLIDIGFFHGRPSILQGEKWDEFEQVILQERLRPQALADKFGLKKTTAQWNRQKVLEQHDIDIREYNKEVAKANPRNYIPRMPKEFYLENYNASFWNFEKNKWSYGCTKVDLSKMCGHSVLLIGKDLYHYGIKKHREDIPSGLDLLGKKFDLLRPVLLIKIDESKVGFSRYVWKCECDCGETCVKSTQSLTGRGHIKIKNSCGCENKKAARWKKLDIYPRHFNRIKASAKIRKLDFDLTPEFLHELYQKQKKKSAISGRKLVMPEVVGNGTGLSQRASDNKDLIASLDRIDSKKGYIKTNVWWISRRENGCKMDLSIDDMQQFFTDGYAHLKESRRIQAEIEAGRFS
jgi:hypothetical protein